LEFAQNLTGELGVGVIDLMKVLNTTRLTGHFTAQAREGSLSIARAVGGQGADDQIL
jgi:hypothetical protein